MLQDHEDRDWRPPRPVGERVPDPCEPVIDLDVVRDDEQPQPPLAARPRAAWRRLRGARIGALPALAVLLAVAATAVTATHRWDVRQQRLARESAVSVVAVVSGGVSGGGGSDGETARWQGLLAVVNSGPEPVQVKDIRAEWGGLSVRSDATLLVLPGVLSTTVRVAVDCDSFPLADPIPLVMSVRTPDGTSHRVSSLVIISEWASVGETMCDHRPLPLGMIKGSVPAKAPSRGTDPLITAKGWFRGARTPAGRARSR